MSGNMGDRTIINNLLDDIQCGVGARNYTYFSNEGDCDFFGIHSSDIYSNSDVLLAEDLEDISSNDVGEYISRLTKKNTKNGKQ